MRTRELYVNVKQPGDLNGQAADVDFGHHVDGYPNIAIHWRRSGYTGSAGVNRVWKSREQSSAVGGHCHWTQLNVLIGELLYAITPQYPGKDFEEWCDECVAMCAS